MSSASLLARRGAAGADALDFAPQFIALQERPPAPLPRAVLSILLVLLVALGTWSCLGKLDIVTVADGRLVPQSYVKIVQPADAGVVQQILVSAGETVAAGQVLMRLDPTVALADRNITLREVELRRLQVRRIEAEIAGRRMLTRPQEAELATDVAAQARARGQAYADALAAERAVLGQAQAELGAVREQIIKLQKVLPSLLEEEQSLDRLAQQGHVPRALLAQKQRERIQTEQDLASQTSTAQVITARIAEAQSRIARISSDYRQQLLTERVEAQSALVRAEQELTKQEHRAASFELRAPQSGIVKEVATSTVGAVVAAGTVLVTLVPVDEDLHAEVFIRNEDVGFVRPGQQVKLKLAAYPFQKYGMLEGTIEQIAADATENTEDGESESAALSATYKALVRLQQQHVAHGGQRLPLAPGMRVAAEIRQGERTVLAYLLSSVEKVIAEAAQER